MYASMWYCFFFFKQKTAYEMRISDWSSDVCSSDLVEGRRLQGGEDPRAGRIDARAGGVALAQEGRQRLHLVALQVIADPDRKSVVSGKSVSVRVDLGGRRIIKKKNKNI